MVESRFASKSGIRIPGYLVDIVVVDRIKPNCMAGAPVNRFISGDFTLIGAQT